MQAVCRYLQVFTMCPHIAIIGLFVSDMMHVPTCERLKTEFLEKYTKDLDITGGGLQVMETFLGMQVESNQRRLSAYT